MVQFNKILVLNIKRADSFWKMKCLQDLTRGNDLHNLWIRIPKEPVTI